MSGMRDRSAAVFDLGGVLIDWNPRYLYRKLFQGDDDAMEHFLATVCTSDWNLQQDAGRSLAEACALLRSGFPAHAKMIDARMERYDEMLAGPIHRTVDLLAELRSRDVPLYALSNWSTETFPAAQERFDFLRWFRGMLPSGHVRLVKSDREFFAFSAKPTMLIRPERFISTTCKPTSTLQPPSACTESGSPIHRLFAANW